MGAGIALALYTFYAFFVTWPLILHPDTLLSGSSISGDLGGSVAQVGYVVNHHIDPFLPATFRDWNAPQGFSNPWVDNWASLPSNIILFGLGWIFGAVASSNIYVWLTLALSAFSMYLLTLRLHHSFGAALLTGFAFGFFPWAVNKLFGHYQYADGFMLVFAFWRFVEVLEAPSRRNAVLFGVAAALGLWWTPYWFLIGGVGFALMELTLLVVRWTRGSLREGVELVFVGATPTIALVVGLGLLAILAGGTGAGQVRTQPLPELYAYSARGLEWVVPDRFNLVFGGATGPYLTRHLDGSNFSEASIYLGISVILLALVGCGLVISTALARRRRALTDDRVVMALLGIVTAVVACVFSAPPKVHVLGLWVPTPSDAIFQFTSTFRVYSRFVELIELGLCLPMGWAVAWLLRRRHTIVASAIFAAVAAVLVLDLWARPPADQRTVSAYSLPGPYAWLREHPGGTVATYPIEPAAYPDYSGIYFQEIDRHPYFEGYGSGTVDETLKLGLAAFTDPRTAADLAMMGVKYVVLPYNYPGATAAFARRSGYRVVYDASGGSVWKVGARPARVEVGALQNFSTLQGDPGETYRWMTGDGVLGVSARHCNSCSGTIVFDTQSNGVPRTLTVRQGRRTLARVTVTATKVLGIAVKGVQLRRGSAQVTLTTKPGPTSPGNGDPRLLSVNVAEPIFKLDH